MNSYAFVRDPLVKVCLLRLEGPDFGAYNEEDVDQYNEMQQLLAEKTIKTALNTMDELLDLQAPGKAVYILPTFRDECPVFKHLLSIKAKIYGTLAVTECLRADIPLLSQTPLLGLTLRNAVVCFTGIDIPTREKKTRIVQQLGGTVAKDLSRSVTHLVASTADPKAPKYAAATKSRLPVLTLDWIDDAWQSAMCYNPARYTERDHYHPAYAMPIFHGLEISASGYGHERPEIMRLIQLHGGTYNGAMSKSKCTHLLAEKNSGEKFQKATEWGLHVVRLEWLKKSVQTGYRLPEEKFAHNRALDTSTFPSLNLSAEPSSSSELVANNTHATPKPTPKRPKAFPQKAEPVAKPPPQRVAPLQKITSMRRSMSTRSLTEAPATVPDLIDGVDVAKCKMSDCLEGCHLYLCGYADAALPKYKTLVRKVGATLSYEQLDAQVTHILVSTAPLDPQTTETLKNPPGEVPVLTARWLLDCATHSDKPRRLAVDAYLYEEAQTKRAEDAPAAGAGVMKPLNARNVEDRSSWAQKNRPTGGALGSAGAAGTQTVPETQAWRPAKSSIFQRQSSTLGAAVNENTAQSDEPSSRTTTATTVSAAYPSTVSSSDTMTTVSSIGTAWTEVGRLGGRSTASNALTLGLNRETTTPERMDCSDPSTEVQTLGVRTTTSKTLTLGLDLEMTTPEQMDSADPTLSTSNANEQTPKQSTPLAMNSRVAMLRFSECGTRRSSIASVHNATMDSMNLSHSPTAYLTGKFPFKLRLKRLGEAEQHLRDMPTPQSSPHTSTDSLSVSAVGRLLAQAVVNTGRGLEQQTVAQVPDNTDQIEVDVDVDNGNEEADDAASTVTAVEPVVVAEPASPSRNRRAPNRFQHSPIKEKPSTPRKRARTPKKTPKSPDRPTPSPRTDRLDADDGEVFATFFESTNTATAVESVASVEPASSSRKRGRTRKKVVRSSTEETSPEANPKPKRQRTARKKQL